MSNEVRESYQGRLARRPLVLAALAFTLGTVAVWTYFSADSKAQSLATDCHSTNVGATPNAIANVPSSATVGQSVAFDGSGSYDGMDASGALPCAGDPPDGTYLTYQWSFGDGTTMLGRNVSHSYSCAGQFEATLGFVYSDNTTAQGYGATDSAIIDVTGNPPCALGGGSTLVIGGCDTGVGDQTLAGGGTFGDAIDACAAGASNHGQFTSCVAHLTNAWKKAGLITGAQKGAIVSCAQSSNLP